MKCGVNFMVQWLVLVFFQQFYRDMGADGSKITSLMANGDNPGNIDGFPDFLPVSVIRSEGFFYEVQGHEILIGIDIYQAAIELEIEYV